MSNCLHYIHILLIRVLYSRRTFLSPCFAGCHLCALDAGALKLEALIVQFPTFRFAFYDSAAIVLETINSNALYNSSLSSGRRTPSPVSDIMRPPTSFLNGMQIRKIICKTCHINLIQSHKDGRSFTTSPDTYLTVHEATQLHKVCKLR